MKKYRFFTLAFLLIFSICLFGGITVAYASAGNNLDSVSVAKEARYEPCDGIHLHGLSCTPTRETGYVDGVYSRKYICDWCGGAFWRPIEWD